MLARTNADADTLADAVARYEGLGFAGQFAVRPGGLLSCTACGRESAAKSVHLLALHRFEGSSDPDDEAALAALQCPNCGSKGTVALSYGPVGSIEDRQVMAGLDVRRRSEGPVHPGI